MPHPLQAYKDKRNFAVTSEPPGTVARLASGRFVVQKHWASRLHYDFRLEVDGVMKSWALPKGPSLDPTVKRMAVEVEDHPVSYAAFEGTIPAGQYGAGRVIVWDQGRWEPLGDVHEGLRHGHLKLELQGQKLHGRWALVRLKKQDAKQCAWLLIKERDPFARAEAEFSVVDAQPHSVKGRQSTHQEARQAEGQVDQEWPAGAVPARLPERLAPQLATLAEHVPPDRAEWLYEIKLDGYRMLARIDGKEVRLMTRNGHDWTSRLEPLRDALGEMGLPNGWYDGEIVVPGADGLPDFGALQKAFDKGWTSHVVFHVFDLPYVDGQDLREVAQIDRRALLARLLEDKPSRMVRLSTAIEGVGSDVLLAACRLGLEGVIAKRKSASYRSVRTSEWLKLKCGKRQEFVIGGFTEGKGFRGRLGALMLGVHRDGDLRFVGKVGTGFDQSTLVALLRRLQPLVCLESPFNPVPKLPGTLHWTKPELVAEVAFSGWTHEGHVRHAVFVGLREDKPARNVDRELATCVAAPAPEPDRPHTPVPAIVPTSSSSVKVTHPERVVDPGTGSTKLDLFRHYHAVGALMLEHVRHRPVALLRAPAGIGGQVFFQKHLSTTLPGISELDPSLSPEHTPWIAVVSRQGLLAAAQWNAVEFHTQNGVAHGFDHPNRLVFDLDPGEGVAWAQVQEAAELTRSLLDALGLRSFLKTSGGKGLHVIVPLRAQLNWDQAKGFSQAVVQHMSQTIPQRFVAKSGPKNRVGKVFVDYLRNGRGATTVSAWSARARPGMGVSVPVGWDELPALQGGDHWTIHNIQERLPVGNGPWRGYARAARSLTGAMKKLGYVP